MSEPVPNSAGYWCYGGHWVVASSSDLEGKPCGACGRLLPAPDSDKDYRIRNQRRELAELNRKYTAALRCIAELELALREAVSRIPPGVPNDPEGSS